jgi:quercetin dioxygenase-like cupin family protein
MHNVKKFILSLFVLSQVGTAAHAQKVGTLLTKKLPEAPGQEIQVIAGNYAPGGGDASHRHDAHVVAYVLEGEVEMQIRRSRLQRIRTLLPEKRWPPEWKSALRANVLQA